jgi:hypothetical protein
MNLINSAQFKNNAKRILTCRHLERENVEIAIIGECCASRNAIP